MDSVWWIRTGDHKRIPLSLRGLALAGQHTDCFSESRDRALSLSDQVGPPPLWVNWPLKMWWSRTVCKADWLWAHETTVGVSLAADSVGAIGTLNQIWPCHPAGDASPRARTGCPSDQTRHKVSYHSPLFFRELRRPKKFSGAVEGRETWSR